VQEGSVERKCKGSRLNKGDKKALAKSFRKRFKKRNDEKRPYLIGWLIEGEKSKTAKHFPRGKDSLVNKELA